MDKWNACSLNVDSERLKGRVCYGGLDLSSMTDITAFVLVFPPRDENDKYYILPYFWLPEDNLTLRVNHAHAPYDFWQKQLKRQLFFYVGKISTIILSLPGRIKTLGIKAAGQHIPI